MLDDYFKCDQVPPRHHAPPFGEFIEGYVARRRSQGRGFATIRSALWHIASFGEHLQTTGTDTIRGLGESDVEEFIESYLSVPNPRGGGPRKGRLKLTKLIRTNVWSLLTYLRDIGVVERPITPLIDESCASDQIRARHLATPFGEFLEEYIAHRRAQGYRSNELRALRYITALGEYLLGNGLKDLRELNEAHIEAFLESYVAGPPRGRSSPTCAEPIRPHLRGFLAYLRDLRVVSPVVPAPSNELIDEYVTFLRTHRGLAPTTIDNQRRWATALVEGLARRSPPVEISAELSNKEVEDVVAELGKSSGFRTRWAMTSAVNCFLSFLRDNGIIPRTFRPFLPRIRSHALASLPSYLEPEDIERVLRHVDRSTPVGRRNYAMLILLATYGLRSCELVELRLEQLHWRQSTLVVWQSKTRRDLVLPMLSQVREALVDYLRHGRPETSDRRVFQKVLPPLGPINSQILYQAVRRAVRKAGIDAPQYGPRLFRHSVATAIVRSGQPLKVAGDLLGHRFPDSTLTYCKLAIEDLRAVALEIPDSGGAS